MKSADQMSKRPRAVLGMLSPLVTTPVWESYVPIRVKSHRSLALNGRGAFSGTYLEVPQAAGVIEISGGRVGNCFSGLWIGFSHATDLPAPTFSLVEGAAVGTIVAPAVVFAGWLALVNQPAYFRIGGDGQRNALSSDQSFWD